MWAAWSGHVAVVQCLVGSGAELNAKNKKGVTALMLAAGKSQLEMVQCLVKAGSDVNTKDRGGNTSLMLATENGYLETAQCLVTAGAELNAKDEDGTTALMLATDKGHVAVAQYLVYSGNPWASSMRQLPNYDAAITELAGHERYRGNRLLSSIRANIESLKATPVLSLMGSDSPSAVTYPARIKLLKARICGVVFPEDFTQSLSGMPLVKFNYIVALMRAAKIANIVHGVNSYFFTRIFMLKSSTNSIRTIIPFTLQAKTLMLELQAISALAIAPATGAAASEGAAEPEHSTVAPVLRGNTFNRF
jgi:hypothetical protein